MKAEHFSIGLGDYMAAICERPHNESKYGDLTQFLMSKLVKGVNLIGACPKMGSSTLAVSLAVELAKSGSQVLYCAHPYQEITGIIYRYLSKDLKHGYPLEPKCRADTNRMSDAFCAAKEIPLKTAPIFNNTTIDELETLLLEEDNIRNTYIFIDSLEDISIDGKLCGHLTPGEYICSKIRDLSFIFQIPIIVVADLKFPTGKSESEDSDILEIGDFRSGELSAYANQIYLLYRPAYYYKHSVGITNRVNEDYKIVRACGGVEGLNGIFTSNERYKIDHPYQNL